MGSWSTPPKSAGGMPPPLVRILPSRMRKVLDTTDIGRSKALAKGMRARLESSALTSLRLAALILVIYYRSLLPPRTKVTDATRSSAEEKRVFQFTDEERTKTVHHLRLRHLRIPTP